MFKQLVISIYNFIFPVTVTTIEEEKTEAPKNIIIDHGMYGTYTVSTINTYNNKI
jgi:hypothetical protein